jgi:hypothetical protein
MLLMAQMVMTVVQSKLVNVGVSPGKGNKEAEILKGGPRHSLTQI